ncbi:VanZ family protein [Ruegeria arenilitoris]|uniref:VanZ family protein n=1 Tax=Ruegeria arenilitoris TaxID=1173585 RepID=UPI003463B84C
MHIIAYAIIVLPLALVRSRTRIWSAVGILIWSGCIELLQPLFGRSSSVSDVIANASGILLGLSLAVFLSRFFPTPTK